MDVVVYVSQFRELYLKGRSLNLPAHASSSLAAMQGETYKILVSRHDVLAAMLDEFTAPQYDPRLPLEVEFMGGKGQDLGGPRKIRKHIVYTFNTKILTDQI